VNVHNSKGSILLPAFFRGETKAQKRRIPFLTLSLKEIAGCLRLMNYVASKKISENIYIIKQVRMLASFSDSNIEET
jgi:hypothetical protein